MRFLPTLTMLIFAAALAVPGASTVSINASVHSFLGTYMPGSLINQSTFTSISYANSTYLLMQLSQGHDILINVTNGHYQFVLSKGSIASILAPYLESAYFPSATMLSAINSSFDTFANGAQSTLQRCLIVTGIDRLNITPAGISENNLIGACYTVPICRSEFLATGANTGPLMQGLLNFSSQYLEYYNGVNAFHSALSGLSTANYGSSISQATGAVNNITSLTATITLNQLFPPPTTITSAQYQGCAVYGSNLAAAPWYCGAIGLCAPITFNTTPLSSTDSQLAAMRSLPVYGSAIAAYAAQVNATEQQYVVPTLIKINTGIYASLLNSTLPKYNATVANATFLLGRFDNASLNSSLAALESAYAKITSAGINQNMTAASQKLNGAINATMAAYSHANAAYEPVLNSAITATASIMIAQLNYRNVPASLARLAVSAEQVDTLLSGRLNSSELAAASAQATNVSSKASGISTPLSLASFVKSVDGPFIGALTPAVAPPASQLASAPLYAALLSLIIGVALLMVFYFATYHRLKHKHHIRHSHRVSRAWMALFTLLALLVVVYAYATYASASSGNSFLPAGAFFGSLRQASTVIIAINSSASTPVSASVFQCAASMQSTLESFGKVSSTVLITNGTCTTGSNPSCYAAFLKNNTPIIQIDPGTNPSIAYRGMYGTVLHAQGTPTYGASCQLAMLVKASLAR